MASVPPVPSALPKDCPPPDAHAVEASFLRFVSDKHSIGDATDAADWILPYAQPKSMYYGQVEDCECHAHSLLADEADIAVARSHVPLFRKKKVATVTITPTMGVVKHTPEDLGASHHDWWTQPPGLVPAATVTHE
ncbi:MAG: hypothetical protein ACYCU0_00885 [Solirubrobacteraceae bacterium]